MVITVTLNPAMDKTLTIEEFSLGKVNRVSSARNDIGGKGINVSKVLKNFGVDSVCTGFLGGILENTFHDELTRRKIEYRFKHIEGNTRTNTKIVDTVNCRYTDVNEAGPVIEKDTLKEFLKDFKEMCNSGDIVVLAGGVSSSVPKDIYAVMTAIAKEKNAYVILDADGELLMEGIKANPHIIKPNEHELGALFNINIESEEELINAAKKLRNDGISKVLVSLGEKGALFITQCGVYYAEGLKVPVKSTVGAGDSMVAAMVYSILNKYDDYETLRFATACGAASVMIEGTEACSLEQVKELLKITKVQIKEAF